MKEIIFAALFSLVTLANAIEIRLPSVDEISIDRASAIELAGMQVRLYNEVLENFVEVRIGDTLALLKEMNLLKPTVIYIHGWLGRLNQMAADSVLGAYLGLNNYNVLQINWHNIAIKRYTYAARSAESVGETIADALNVLVASGLNATGLHVVGHSLGAHVSGHIGRNVNFTLPRITGLDPARPLFQNTEKRLGSTDAEFVDVMHTDAGVYGIDETLGHADFWPNGGTNIQPGCMIGLDICSHNNANFYWAESVTNPRAFVGLECSSYSKFNDNFCGENSKIVMGLGTPNTARGNFYLQTNQRSPYGRGVAGSTKRYSILEVLGTL